MKRKLIPLVAVVAVALGALIAQAGTATAQRSHHDGWGWFGGGFFHQQQNAVKGTVVSVGTSSFTANLTAMEGMGNDDNDADDQGSDDQGSGDDDQGGFSGSGGLFHNDQMSPPSGTSTPTTPTPVTINVNSSTQISINGTTATLSQLAAGDKFIATFAPSTTMTTPGTVPSTPALTVMAFAPPQVFAFVGTVTTAPTAVPGSLGVTVMASSPNGFFANGAATFMIGADTRVFSIGGSSGDMMGDWEGGSSQATIAANDIVVGWEIGTAGETAAQVEAAPLTAVLDFPATASTSTTPSSMPAAATTMTKRLMKKASFNRAIRRLMKHRKAHRVHHRAHHARHHA